MHSAEEWLKTVRATIPHPNRDSPVIPDFSVTSAE